MITLRTVEPGGTIYRWRLAVDTVMSRGARQAFLVELCVCECPVSTRDRLTAALRTVEADWTHVARHSVSGGASRGIAAAVIPGRAVGQWGGQSSRGAVAAWLAARAVAC